MKPVKFEGQSHVLTAPKSWSRDEPCAELPIYSDVDGLIYSVWQPSMMERFKLLFGTPVRLCVAAQGMPPISLEVTDMKWSAKQ